MSTRFNDPRLQALHQRNQSALLDFLNTDLDVATTFLDIARRESREDGAAALTKARVALDTVRKFLLRLDDARSAADIGSRADRLDADLARYLASCDHPSQA